jgi:hypothetical protein
MPSIKNNNNNNLNQDSKKLISVVISTIILLIIYYVIYLYVRNLEVNKCECSQHWYRDYIKYFTIGAMIFLVINLINLKINTKFTNILIGIMNGLLTIFSLVFIYVVYNYANMLVESKCECSMTNDNKNMFYFMKYYNYLQISLLLLSLLFIVYMSCLMF